MKEFKIYLSGGMTNLSSDEQCGWRDLITDMLITRSEVYDIKYRLDIFNPPNYYNFHNPTHLSESEVKKFDLRNTKSSDLIIVNFNDPSSIGTSKELAVAYDRDIPILGLNQDYKELHPWLIDDCDRIFDDMNELVNYVINYYLK